MDVNNIVLIGNSHHYPLTKAAVYPSGKFDTPIGALEINETLARKIISESALFEENRPPHIPEHSLEVQIPFLLMTLKNIKIVPILMGNENFSLAGCKQAGEAVAKAIKGLGLEGKTIIIASSDLSHYPSWANANMSDGASLKAIGNFDPEALEKTNSSLMSSSVPNLACTLCGIEGVYTVMYAAKALGADKAQILHYENSGDVTGDKSRVVGYGAAVFYKEGAAPAGSKNLLKTEKKMSDFGVSEKNQKELLKVARLSIENYLKTRKTSNYKTSDPELLTLAAVFVTLTINGALRGCIGTTEPHAPLYEAVNQLAVAAAVEDYRFSPLTMEELLKTHIEISVLSPLTRVGGAGEIKEGVNGVVVRRGGRSGLFLPQVWEQIPKKEDFLNELCWQKAGLEPAAWKDPKTELYTFTVFAFEEPKN
jgi:AmmeMemoRadiSam system protein A/AmmeMemoRadiSam system protein B